MKEVKKSNLPRITSPLASTAPLSTTTTAMTSSQSSSQATSSSSNIVSSYRAKLPSVPQTTSSKLQPPSQSRMPRPSNVFVASSANKAASPTQSSSIRPQSKLAAPIQRVASATTALVKPAGVKSPRLSMGYSALESVLYFYPNYHISIRNR